jgi:ferredoxin
MGFYSITIKDKDRCYEAQVADDRYLLEALEEQGIELPFACRQGACTTCAVKIRSGQMEQSEAIGIGLELKNKGYGLICIGKARSSLIMETQSEDEVYQLQFGKYFRKQRRRWFSFGLPISDIED